jgi:hypothetical protein
MRDPARIDPLLSQLGQLWRRHPQLRLAQLLVNLANPANPCPEIYYLDDDELATRLERMLADLDSGS